MRLIDADALRDFLTQDEIRLRKEYDKENDDTILAWIQESEFIQNKIQEMPTIDAEPIRHGHWIKMSDADGYYYACSECGEELYREQSFDKEFDTFPKLKSIDKTRYCPNCGAKMDEVEE